jgi:hypothetical protein
MLLPNAKGRSVLFLAASERPYREPQSQAEGCPLCAASIREREIFFLLTELRIDFEFQKSFENLRSPRTGRKLRFDFYIESQKTALEYNGILHSDDKGLFTPISIQSLNFAVKQEFASANGIELVTIDFFDKRSVSETIIELFVDTTIQRQ